MEGTGEREGRVFVICESDFLTFVFIDIVCNNVVRKLAFMALNTWMIVKWQVCARKRSWLNLRKSPCIYVM